MDARSSRRFLARFRSVVGLDWIERPIALKGMQAACRSAGWPVVFRNTESVDRTVWLPMLRKAIGGIVRRSCGRGACCSSSRRGIPPSIRTGRPKRGTMKFCRFILDLRASPSTPGRNAIPAAIVPVGCVTLPAGQIAGRSHLRLGEPSVHISRSRQQRLTARSSEGHRIVQRRTLVTRLSSDTPCSLWRPANRSCRPCCRRSICRAG